jgi:hypothetical protein
VFVVATAVAVLTLLPVTMPRLRPWRLLRGPVPAAYRGTRRGTTPRPAGPVLNGASSSGAAPIQHAPFPGPAPLPAAAFPAAAPRPAATRYPDAPFPDNQFANGQLPWAGRLPSVDPVAPFAPAYPVDPLGPGPASNGPAPDAGPAESLDPLAPPQRRDAQPW